jgi:hypothetical protein
MSLESNDEDHPAPAWIDFTNYYIQLVPAPYRVCRVGSTGITPVGRRRSKQLNF